MKNRVRAIREERHMSQFDLSIKSHVHPSLLSMLEAGKLSPWPAAKRRLAAALGVEEADLFPPEGVHHEAQGQ